MATSVRAKCALGALALVAALTLGGCAKPAQPAGSLSSSESTLAAAITTASASGAATATSATSATTPAGGSSSGGTATNAPAVRKSISPTDAAAIDAELSAIEKELGKLDVPGTSDFDSIGSGLK